MEKYLKYILTGLVCFWAFIFTQRSCTLYDENAKLKGKLEARTESLALAEQRTALLQEVYAKTVIEKNQEIADLEDQAKKNLENSAIGDKKIKELKEELAKISPSEKDKIIENLTRQNDILENNLTLAYQTIEAKDKIIFSWEQKFASCADYVAALEQENMALRGLKDTQAALIKGLEKSLGRNTFQINVSKSIICVLAGIVIYQVVK